MSIEDTRVEVSQRLLASLAKIPLGSEIIEERDLILYRNGGAAITVGDVLDARDVLAQPQERGADPELIAWLQTMRKKAQHQPSGRTPINVPTIDAILAALALPAPVIERGDGVAEDDRNARVCK